MPRASLWTSAGFRDLSTSEKLVAAYIATGPHVNAAGYFTLDEPAIARGLHRYSDAHGVRLDVLRVLAVLGWHVDTTAGVMWLPAWRAWHPAPTLAALRAALNDAVDVEHARPSALFGQWLDHAGSGLRAKRAAWWDAQTAVALDQLRRATAGNATPSPSVAGAASPSVSFSPPTPPPLTSTPPRSSSAQCASGSALSTSSSVLAGVKPSALFDLEAIPTPERDQIPGRPTAAAVIARYCALWASRYGFRPMLSSPDLGAARRIAETLPLEAFAVVEAFMRSDDPWTVERRHAFTLLTSGRINAILAAPVAPRMSQAAATSGDWRTRRPRT